MKLLQKNGKNLLVVTKVDWLRMGQESKWLKKMAIDGYYTPGALDNIGEITVQKYGKDFWAVYVDGLLLCVTVYKRAAFSVKSLVEELTDKIRQLERQPRQLERPEIAQQENERREAV